MGNLIQRLKIAAHGDSATVGEILDEARHVSLHALALAPALLIVTPLSTIPGLSAVGGLIIFFVCGQQVFGRKRLWLPHAIVDREFDPSKLEKFFKVASKIASGFDRLFRPRLTFLVHPPMPTVINAICAALGICMPVLEFIPTSSSIVAAIIVILQLALLTRDGLLAAVGLVVLGAAPFALKALLGTVFGT